MKLTSYIVHRTSYIIILLALLLTGCHDKEETPVEPVPQPRAEAERTVIVYMAGDNSLGNAAFYNAIPLDTAEMVKGKALIPEDVNYIVFIDDKQNTPAIYELSAKSGMQLWKQYKEELCTTNADVMLSVLREIEYYFPARHYGITLWSHASGWVPERTSTRRNSFGKDETLSADSSGKLEMEIPVLRDVLAQLPKFDYIFFDACFMQSIEVAYELRNVTDYMIGSPAEIPGPGAPYDKVIEALCKSDVEGIVRGYGSGYPGAYDRYFYPGVLLSCIDCTGQKLEALAEATGQLLTPIYMDHLAPSSQRFQYYCNVSLNKFSFCFDMRTTMRRLLLDEEYDAWMELFNQAVPLYTYSDPPDGYSLPLWLANYCNNPVVQDPDCYGGVSMFVPMVRYDNEGYSLNQDFQKTSWYKAAGWDATGW